jgi:hypothetical protein
VAGIDFAFPCLTPAGTVHEFVQKPKLDFYFSQQEISQVLVIISEKSNDGSQRNVFEFYVKKIFFSKKKLQKNQITTNFGCL